VAWSARKIWLFLYVSVSIAAGFKFITLALSERLGTGERAMLSRTSREERISPFGEGFDTGHTVRSSLPQAYSSSNPSSMQQVCQLTSVMVAEMNDRRLRQS
jgi:hypothetical protein